MCVCVREKEAEKQMNGKETLCSVIKSEHSARRGKHWHGRATDSTIPTKTHLCGRYSVCTAAGFLPSSPCCSLAPAALRYQTESYPARATSAWTRRTPATMRKVRVRMVQVGRAVNCNPGAGYRQTAIRSHRARAAQRRRARNSCDSDSKLSLASTPATEKCRSEQRRIRERSRGLYQSTAMTRELREALGHTRENVIEIWKESERNERKKCGRKKERQKEGVGVECSRGRHAETWHRF